MSKKYFIGTDPFEGRTAKRLDLTPQTPDPVRALQRQLISSRHYANDLQRNSSDPKRAEILRGVSRTLLDAEAQLQQLIE